jgi:hypothetical protein
MTTFGKTDKPNKSLELTCGAGHSVRRLMSSVTKNKLFRALAVWLFFSTALSAIPTYLAIQHWRLIHWLNADGRQATATVTSYDRPVLKYSYTADGKEFTGRLKTSRQYGVGDKLDVFFSYSHPWISSLGRPPLSSEGGGYVAVVFGLSLLVLIPVVLSLRNEKAA